MSIPSDNKVQISSIAFFGRDHYAYLSRCVKFVCFAWLKLDSLIYANTIADVVLPEHQDKNTSIYIGTTMGTVSVHSLRKLSRQPGEVVCVCTSPT